MSVRAEVIEPGPWFCVGPIRQAEWVRVTISLPIGPTRRLRFLHLSDLHTTGRPHPILGHLASRLADDPPDAILVTGDFVDDRFLRHPREP
jgi:predicted MPP superfamily phosphohydrolase